MNLLNYTKKSGVSYSAGQFDSGYHSFDLDGHHFSGQRDPKLRFKDLPISLEGKSVLDIGCNQGGMIHAFSDDLSWGVGVDYDSRMINVANRIRSFKSSKNTDFYVFDLEQEPLDYISDMLPEARVDVVLLLSVCMWIKNWKEVIRYAESISSHMIFETNGSEEQQGSQIAMLQSVYKKVELIHERSEDDASQKLRKLYYCTQG